MEPRKLIPYSVFLRAEQHAKIKTFAKTRKASELIRDAVDMMLSGTDLYSSGYNKAIKDAAKIIYECEEAQMIAVKGKDLGAILAEKIDTLEIKK
jgi:hypothetical protein